MKPARYEIQSGIFLRLTDLRGGGPVYIAVDAIVSVEESTKDHAVLTSECRQYCVVEDVKTVMGLIVADLIVDLRETKS